MYGTVCVLIQYIVMYIYVLNLKKNAHIIFSTSKGLMSACIELVGLSISNKAKNHCIKSISYYRLWELL